MRASSKRKARAARRTLKSAYDWTICRPHKFISRSKNSNPSRANPPPPREHVFIPSKEHILDQEFQVVHTWLGRIQDWVTCGPLDIPVQYAFLTWQMWSFYHFLMGFYHFSMGFHHFSMGFHHFSMGFYHFSMGFHHFLMGFEHSFGFSPRNFEKVCTPTKAFAFSPIVKSHSYVVVAC